MDLLKIVVVTVHVIHQELFIIVYALIHKQNVNKIKYNNMFNLLEDVFVNNNLFKLVIIVLNVVIIQYLIKINLVVNVQIKLSILMDNVFHAHKIKYLMIFLEFVYVNLELLNQNKENV